MKHEGEILEKAIRNSGVSIAFIAKKTGYSRRHFYNLFQNKKLSIDLLLHIGEIINYDFTADIKKLGKLKDESKSSANKEIDFWKNKYLEILEKHNSLLEKVKIKLR